VRNLHPVGAIIRTRLVSACIAFGFLMLAWTLTADVALGYPLILLKQGVSSLRFGTEVIDGVTVPKSVFVIRDGSVITVLGKTTPGTGSRLVYCPAERFFVSPEDAALFDRSGQYVQGPGTRDMDEYRRQVDPEALALYVGERTERPRSNGQISGEAAEAYLTWKADPSVPQRFCQDPVQ